MTSAYHSYRSSSFPLELNEDQQHLQFFSAKSQASSSSSSFSNPVFFNHDQDQGGDCSRESKQFRSDQEVDRFASNGGSCDHLTLSNERDDLLTEPIRGKENKIEEQSETSSVKWIPSKMRMMRKMMSSSERMGVNIPVSSMQKLDDQKRRIPPSETGNSSNNSLNNINTAVRVCADCNTTKTPLWRSGPSGPKSLCNACGIRQRKARRAMAAAAAAANGTILAANPTSMKSKIQREDKRSRDDYVPKFKKKCKITTPSHSIKKLRFEDFAVSLSKNSAFQRVFPQDEKEAAILLMALSYGLVHG